MTQNDMFNGSPEPSSKTPAKAAPAPDARIGEHGRMTTCCGACSTIDQDTGELYCKACHKVVPEGEGDGGGRITIDLADARHESRGTLADSQDAREFYDNANVGDHASLADAGDTASGMMAGEHQPKAATPQVDALPGMTPLGINPFTTDPDLIKLLDDECRGSDYGDDDEPTPVNTEQWDANCHRCGKPCRFDATSQFCDACRILEAQDFINPDLPLVTLKRVEYSEMNSTDSHCFGAVVLLDGKEFCAARDGGFGGEQDYDAIRPKAGWTPGQCREAGDIISKRIAEIDAALLIKDGSTTHDRKDGTSFTIENNCFDYIICNLVNEWLAAKDLRKLLKKRVVYFTDGKIMQTKCAKSKAQLACWIEDSKPEEGMVLNSLAFNVALKLFREAT